ncbi:MAG: hypothetical protein QXJ59_07845 [Thermofilaceae archaeon]
MRIVKKICGTEREALLVPDTKVYFIVKKDFVKALKLLLYLNSDLACSLLKLIAWVARGGYYEHKSVYTALLPFPVALLNCRVWSEFLKAAVRTAFQDGYNLNRIAEKVHNEYGKKLVDELIRSMGVSEEEYNALIEYGRWLNELGGEQRLEVDLEEDEE